MGILKKVSVALSVWMVVAFIIMGLTIPADVNAKASAKFTDSLTKCVDGDTAHFKKAGYSRFLYVDTPESTKKIEPYGKTASQYTCTKLKKAKKIQLQYDGARKDKYGRTLVWVWVDGQLLQELLVKKGYVKKFYDYGTYSYESKLVHLQAIVKKKKKGLWSGKKEPSVAKTSSAKKKKPATTKKTNFKNCTELRKYYPHGVSKSHPAYQSKMDRDHDGWACER